MPRVISIAIDVRMHSSSGIGTYVTHVLPLIIRARPDWQFFLLGPSAELAAYDWSAGDNVHVRECNAPIYSAAEQFRIASSTPRNVDLFWAPHYNIPLLITFPLRARTKLLVTIHDVFHLAMPQHVRWPHRRLYARAMFGAVRRRADGILCVSHFTQREFRRLVGEREPAPRMVHSGVDESWFSVTKHASPHEKPFLLFVGNVKPHKNLIGLLRAFRLVMDDVPHDLIIVGKQEGFLTTDAAGVRMAQELGGRVHFTGIVDQSHLQQYFAHAAAFVFPSFYEGFGLPPLEAMACGCPVIASTAASIPEVCGDAVLYCDPMNPQDIAWKIQMLLRDADLQAMLRANGRQRASVFRGWGRCAQETLRVIQELVAH